MKLSLLILSLSLTCALSVHALDVTNTRPVMFGFKWNPPAWQYGGLSTNDYFTNVSFKVYSTTNITVPVTNWTVVATWPAQPLLSQGPWGSQWTQSVIIDCQTRFAANSVLSISNAADTNITLYITAALSRSGDYVTSYTITNNDVLDLSVQRINNSWTKFLSRSFP